MRRNTTALIFLSTVLAAAPALLAQDVPDAPQVGVKEQAARDFERLRQAKIAQLNESHEQRITKIQQEFEANMKSLRSDAIVKQLATHQEQLERAKDSGPIAVYLQHRPQAEQQHAVHILTADGRSMVMRGGEAAAVAHGKWNPTPHGIELLHSENGTRLKTQVLLKSAGATYVAVETSGQLQNMEGHLLVGDPGFLSQREANISGGSANQRIAREQRAALLDD